MPHVSIPIGPGGPLFDAYIYISKARHEALEKAQKPTPTASKVRALLDTGASCTCVDPSVLQTLSIPSRGTSPMNTPSAGDKPQTVNLYDIGLGIQGHTAPALIFETVQVAGTELLKSQGFHVLIGRDILSRCVFHYNGPGNQIIVSY